MPVITFRPAVRGALVAATVLALAACSSAPASETEPATHTVTDLYGEVAIPNEPKAALGFYTTDLDMLITLGVPLASLQPIRSDGGYTGFPSYFNQEALEGITPFENFPEPNFEKIAEAAPDVILNGIGGNEVDSAKLATIAPTFSYNAFDGSDWRDGFKKAADALGRTAQFDEWTAKYQARVDEVKAKLEAKKIDPLVASIGYFGGEVNVSCYALPCRVFADLGLRISPLADGPDDDSGTNLSLEQLDQLSDIDVMFSSVDTKGEGLIGTSEDMVGNKLWAALPAVTNDQLFSYDMEIVYDSPSGQMAFLDVVEKALVG